MGKYTNAVFKAVAGKDKQIRDVVRKSAQAAADILVLQFNEAVKDWDDKPKFVVIPAPRMFGVGFRVETRGSKDAKLHWLWTDKGTKPHKIRAKNAPSLAFQVGYQAKTAPIAQFGVGNGKASGEWVRTMEVNHPGTAAREFSKTFVDELMPLFLADIKANLKAINRS